MRIGYPRALLYYQCFPFWNGFFAALGHQVVVSTVTTRAILQTGSERAVGEACLPVKLFYGHTLDLCGRVDRLFLPRLVSLEPRTYICPKFMGLPSMIRASLPGLAPVIGVDVDNRKRSDGGWGAARRVGHALGHSTWQVWRAYRQGSKAQEDYERLLLAGYEPEEAIQVLQGAPPAKTEPAPEAKRRVLLLGHPYNVHDSGFNLQSKKRLRRLNLEVITMEQVDPALARTEADGLPKDIFWGLGRRMVGTSLHLLRRKLVDGIIHLAAFGCGPDSMMGEVVERSAHKQGVPFLSLILDEHTGEAGFLTRVEAFAEMLARRSP